MQSLTYSAQELHKLLKSYETSICQYRISRFALPPTGCVLSSGGVVRHTLKYETFEAIAEIERRESRIHHILYSSFVNMARPPFLEPLEGIHQENFADMIRRSLRHCDAMADLAANVPGAAITEQQYQTMATGGSNTRVSRDEIAALFLNFKVRPAQIEYIKQLPADDLAGLYLTVMALSAGFVQANDWVRWDPNYPEQVTVFEECILRHGTWFLWTQVAHGEDVRAQAAVVNRMLRAGFAELIDWETGKADMEPGLRMSLLGAAMTKLTEIENARRKEGEENKGENENEIKVEEEGVDLGGSDDDYPDYTNPVDKFLFKTMDGMLRGVATNQA